MKYLEKIIKEKYLEVSTPDELMDFLNKYITYGWLDIYNHPHIDTLKYIKRLYKINSLDTVLQSGLGTCIEQAKLIKCFFDRNGIENHVFCSKYWKDIYFILHCFVIFAYNGKYYYFEHSNPNLRGIRCFNTMEDALNFFSENSNYSDKRTITEIDEIPDDYTLEEFNEYVDSFREKNKEV